MNVLDLFSGIGGFSLGLERAGMRTIAFCEIEPYCRAVLAKRWPGVPIHSDVRELSLPRGFADVICGGFPCQDISFAGDGAGLAGARSGLWAEFFRTIAQVRPAWAIIENVSALRSRGLEAVLRQLTTIGYDAEWHCIPASAVGAPHQRDRVWIIAYPCSDSHEPRLEGWLREELRECARELSARALGAPVPDADVAGQQQHAQLNGSPISPEQGPRGHDIDRRSCPSWWSSESGIQRVADGVPSRVDRLRALGNAVVPQIPEIIGRAIIAWEQQQ
jgi:DNA (cytosine-5)-methyltransferase 1